jgi:hypothetical protein
MARPRAEGIPKLCRAAGQGVTVGHGTKPNAKLGGGELTDPLTH